MEETGDMRGYIRALTMKPSPYFIFVTNLVYSNKFARCQPLRRHAPCMTVCLSPLLVRYKSDDAPEQYYPALTRQWVPGIELPLSSQCMTMHIERSEDRIIMRALDTVDSLTFQ